MGCIFWGTDDVEVMNDDNVVYQWDFDFYHHHRGNNEVVIVLLVIDHEETDHAGNDLGDTVRVRIDHIDVDFFYRVIGIGKSSRMNWMN